MKDLSENIEFFTPGMNLDLAHYIESGDVSSIHHIARYKWARHLVGDSSCVMDIACGSGYGSYIIAKANPNSRVIGVDYDPRALIIAQRIYTLPNLSYQAGDIVNWKFESGESMGSPNTVVSFDTLEHLDHRDITLVRIAENLCKDGQLIFSTPSGHQDPVLKPGWEYHKIEYSGSFLFNLMSRFFNIIQFPDDRSLPFMDFWDQLNSAKPLYWNRMNPIVCKSPIKKGLTH